MESWNRKSNFCPVLYFIIRNITSEKNLFGCKRSRSSPEIMVWKNTGFCILYVTAFAGRLFISLLGLVEKVVDNMWCLDLPQKKV